jgi:hypothetical protein
MKTIVQVTAYILLLVGSVVFGFLGKPAEMGLLIVAAALALAFSDLEKFSRIKGAGFEAELREKVEAVIEKETEPPVFREKGQAVPDVSRIDKATLAVVDALRRPEYTWRYMAGIKHDTKLSTDEVQKSLSWLVNSGYAKQTQGKHGTVWNLTEDGRYLSAVIDFCPHRV